MSASPLSPALLARIKAHETAAYRFGLSDANDVGAAEASLKSAYAALVAAIQAEVQAARQQALKYAQHLGSCASHRERWVWMDIANEQGYMTSAGEPCDCGLDELLGSAPAPTQEGTEG